MAGKVGTNLRVCPSVNALFLLLKFKRFLANISSSLALGLGGESRKGEEAILKKTGHRKEECGLVARV